MLIGVLLAAYGVLLLAAVPAIFRATRMLGRPQWPWWLFMGALAGVALDRLSTGLSVIRGAEPPVNLPQAVLYACVGLALAAGSLGLRRFIQEWYDDRERRFQRTIWSSLTEVYLLDPETLEVIDHNRGARAVLSGSGRRVAFPSLLSSPAGAFRAALAPLTSGAREAVSIPVEMTGADGTRPVRLTVQETREEERRALVVFVTDRSAEADAERKAVDEAERFRLMAESIHEGIILTRTDGTIVYESPRTGPLLGVDHRTRPGGNVLDWIAPDTEQGARRVLEELGSGEREVLEGVQKFVRADDGREVWLEFRGRKVNFPGVGESFLFSCGDVTRRIEAEARRRTSRERLQRQQRQVVALARSEAVREGRVAEAAARVARAVAAELPVARGSVWLMEEDEGELRIRRISLAVEGNGGDGGDRRDRDRDEDGEHALVLRYGDNPPYFDALTEGRVLEAGDACTDPRTRAFRESYLEPLGIGAMLDASVRAGDVAGVVCAEHVGGPREWSAEEVSFLGEMADLMALALQESRRRQAESERSALAAQLRVAQRMETLGVMAGGIAHDFNNLLTPILGYTEMALEELPDRDREESTLAEIRSAAERAQALVRQLLTFSRQVEHERKPVNAGALLREVLRLARASLPSTIDLRTDLPPDLPAVHGDSSQLHQVFMNLVNNAGYAMRDAGGTLEVALDTCTLDSVSDAARIGLTRGRYVRVQVADSGVGMDADTLERIFEPFFTTKPQGEGTGLGMAVTHGIVVAHRGRILVDSAPGAGTRVEVFLPLSPEDTDARAEDVLGTGPSPRDADRSVLVVDDEAAVARFVTRVLERAGYRVSTYTDSPEAARALESGVEDPDLLLTDQTMPGLTGLGLVERVRAEKPDLPVVVMSGYDTALDGPALAAARVQEFLRKPFRARDLLAALSRACGEPVPDESGGAVRLGQPEDGAG